MKAVIYARYSSDSQREESIEGQLRECTEYAERNGITILRSYIDRALSARTADRPEFQNMIKDSEQKLFDVVLIWKLDRFSRDRYDSAHYKRILKKNGVKVVSVKENISDGPEGIILESMLEGYAEYYSAELSEKIQRGQKENALKRKNNGGNTPLGYVVGTDGVLAVDPLTAPLVTEIFTRYDSGESISEITASLNGRGLKTKKGKAFKIGGISLILKNRKYIGEYQYGSVIIPKGIPAIIDDDLFDRVQRRMAFNKKAPAKAKATEEYLLTTKLFCGTCERLMAGESGTSSTKGVKHYYYKCGGAKRKLGCKRKAVRKHWIERAAVLVTVQRVLQDDEISRIAEAIVALQEKEDTSLPAMRQQLTGCEKAIDNMLNAIQMGVLTASTKERLEKLEMQREELKLSILQAQMARPRYTKEQVVSWISRFKYGNVDDPQYQKQIIDTFINSIYVFDDKLVFTYNFKDGTETITLAEIQAAFGSDLTQVAPPQESDRFYNRSLFHFFPFPGVHVLMSKFVKRCIGFVQKETILCIAIALALIFSMIVPPNLSYIAYVDWDTLFLLFSLMAVTKGFQKAGLFLYLGNHLIKRATTSRKMLFSLVFLPFISSMVITNDVSLLIFVPFGLTVLQMANQESLIVPLVVMQTVAANLGSMLTPMGNPQNLYLYTKFNLHFGQLCQLMLPYVLLSALCLTLLILFRRSTSVPMSFSPAKPPDPKCFLCSSVGFSLCLLGIFQTIPPILIALCIFIFLFFTDKSVLADLDYSLLGTFFALFIFIGNLGCIGDFQTFLASLLTNHVAPVAMLTSQVISNVPTALLLSGFTSQWQALMIGCNLGGLGSLIASMASLISYKVVAKEYPDQRKKYLLCFTVCNLCLGGLLLLACFLMNHLHLL